ncbi:toll/interleukin-1 receptor domain-containing protein [Frankia sp. AgB1.9]|nr:MULTISPECIES: toll/interleukin-1 receptor domain-containing protein [unclassified Frankia]MBL7488603.1 toll/interleukin-1 receptor domain-containing protein [Frankia sp. AgW1.1]MBL7551419.1 toll/interleukin-1 receptor domain-containing protein [Frankia sp. AgB1.9]MBL7622672.1 toll/interleukin-1 receptor domain-containing protein [Frankia sp. AgB1.8]
MGLILAWSERWGERRRGIGVDGGQWDFFVSYTQVDRRWAEWIAWELEDAGYQVLLQAWDMVPGSNWTVAIGSSTSSSPPPITWMPGTRTTRSKPITAD